MRRTKPKQFGTSVTIQTTALLSVRCGKQGPFLIDQVMVESLLGPLALTNCVTLRRIAFGWDSFLGLGGEAQDLRGRIGCPLWLAQVRLCSGQALSSPRHGQGAVPFGDSLPVSLAYPALTCRANEMASLRDSLESNSCGTFSALKS
jgi:hypothetical protein